MLSQVGFLRLPELARVEYFTPRVTHLERDAASARTQRWLTHAITGTFVAHCEVAPS